jgi:hypothetical protein
VEVCEGVVECGGPGVEPRGLHKVLINEPKSISQYRGATWQPFIGPRGTFPFAYNMPRVTMLLVHSQPIDDCHITCHVDCTVATSAVRPLPRQLYGLPSQHQIFACLPWRTDHDNFSIRTPFAKVNIPPESGR